jgi:hypothetical protein
LHKARLLRECWALAASFSEGRAFLQGSSRSSRIESKYVAGFVEGCLERIGEDDQEGEDLLRGEWEEGDKEMVLEILRAECEVRAGRPECLS